MRYNHLLLALLLIFNASLFGQAVIYTISDDYGTLPITSFKEITHEKNMLVLTNNDGTVKSVDLSKENIWGYRNSWGEDYRIANAKSSQQIIEFGSICIYSRAENSTATTSSPYIIGGWEDNPYVLSGNHSFSIGANGKMIKFKKSRFLKALRTDPKIYAKF